MGALGLCVLVAGGCGSDSSGDDDDDTSADDAVGIDDGPGGDGSVPDGGVSPFDATPTFDAAPPDAAVPDAVPNSPPTISAIDDQSTKSDPIGPIAFTIGDLETPVGSLIVTAVSSDEAVVPNVDLVLGGADANRTITVMPIAGGMTTVTVTVDDGADTADETFLVTVTNAGPLAVDDAYPAIGNTQMTVAPVDGVLANDTDGDSDPLGVTAGTIATSMGGSVDLAADGSFVYTPPVGVAGVADSFDYTVSDGFESDTGTATLNLGSLVWYVDNTESPSGDGSSTAPFQSLAEAQAASGLDDIIYVYAGDGTTAHQDAGISLKNGQTLVGQGVELVVDGVSLVPAGTPPVITNTGGNGVTLSKVNVVHGLTIDTPLGDGVNGNSIEDVTLEDLTILRTGGQGIDVGHPSPTGTVTLRVRNNTIHGNMVDFTTTTVGIDLSVQGVSGGNVDAEISGNDIRGVSAGMFVAFAGTTGTGLGGPNALTISGNTIVDFDDDALQIEPDDTASSRIDITDNVIDGVDAVAGGIPARGLDFRLRTAPGGVTVSTISGNTVRDTTQYQCMSIVASGSGNGGTLTVAVTGNTLQSCNGEGLFMAPDDDVVFNATVTGNTMTGNGNPSSFEFYTGTAHRMDLNLANNEDDVGFQLERDSVGVLRLGGSLGAGSSFDDDNGNVGNNGNTTGGGAPNVTIAGTGNQIQIIDPAAIPTP